MAAADKYDAFGLRSNVWETVPVLVPRLACLVTIRLKPTAPAFVCATPSRAWQSS